MIQVGIEDVFPITELAARLPRLRPGRKPHISTIYRWMNGGVRGARLETMLVGGTRCTSREAVERFLAALNGEQTIPSNTRRRAALCNGSVVVVPDGP